MALYREGELVGVAPFLKRRWNWDGRLGYRRVVRFPVDLIDLCGEELLAPEEAEAQETLLLGLDQAVQQCHLLFLESLRVGSTLWNVLKTSPDVRRRFWIYQPKPASPRRMVELGGSFDDYLAKFSPRTRGNFRNKVSKLERACAGQLSVERVTAREQVPGFLDRVERLSLRSWQGARLGQVIRATPYEAERLAAYADQGWLRSYVLSYAEEPLAFAVGYQADGTYLYATPGYDPAWGHLRVATVLLYKIIDDLTRFQPARRLDFGYGDNEYKAIFANHSYEEANVYLVRRSPYTALALTTIRALTSFSSVVRRELDRLRLREMVRHWLRGRASRRPG